MRISPYNGQSAPLTNTKSTSRSQKSSPAFTQSQVEAQAQVQALTSPLKKIIRNLKFKNVVKDAKDTFNQMYGSGHEGIAKFEQPLKRYINIIKKKDPNYDVEASVEEGMLVLKGGVVNRSEGLSQGLDGKYNAINRREITDLTLKELKEMVSVNYNTAKNPFNLSFSE